MKKLLLSSLFSILFCSKDFAQTKIMSADIEKVIVDNSKIKVTEFTSIPNRNVCGKEMHTHGPHLTVILTDADVEIILPDGKKMTQKVAAGTSFWSEGETHAIRNAGRSPLRVQIIETK